MSAGKGDKPRPYDPKAFAAGWERIYGKKREDKRCTLTQPKTTQGK